MAGYTGNPQNMLWWTDPEIRDEQKECYMELQTFEPGDTISIQSTVGRDYNGIFIDWLSGGVIFMHSTGPLDKDQVLRYIPRDRFYSVTLRHKREPESPMVY